MTEKTLDSSQGLGPVAIEDADIASPDAIRLLGELNKMLVQITGSSGAASFDSHDVASPRSCFVVARINGIAVGCGALRPHNETSAELKRVYARPNQCGVGSQIIAALETRAKQLGYRRIFLETRAVNQCAISFYRKHGYCPTPNYGKYAGRCDAICFCKPL